MNKLKGFRTAILIVVATAAILIINIFNYIEFDTQRQGKDFDVYLTSPGLSIFSLETNNDNPVPIELYSKTRFELKKDNTDEKAIHSDRVLNIWTIKTNIEPRINWIVEGRTKIQAIVRNQEYVKIVFRDEVAIIIVNIFNIIIFFLITTTVTVIIIKKKYAKRE